MQSVDTSTTSKNNMETTLSGKEWLAISHFLGTLSGNTKVPEGPKNMFHVNHWLSIIEAVLKEKDDKRISAEQCRDLSAEAHTLFSSFGPQGLTTDMFRSNFKSALDKLQRRAETLLMDEDVIFDKTKGEGQLKRIALEDCQDETEFVSKPPKTLSLGLSDDASVKFLKAWGNCQRTLLNKDRFYHSKRKGARELWMRCSFCKSRDNDRSNNTKRRRIPVIPPKSNCKWMARYLETRDEKTHKMQWVLQDSPEAKVNFKHNHPRLDNNVLDKKHQSWLCDIWSEEIVELLRHNFSPTRVRTIINNKKGHEGALSGQTLANFHKKMQKANVLPLNSASIRAAPGVDADMVFDTLLRGEE